MNVVHLITTIERGGAENQLKVLVSNQITQGIQVEIVPLKGKLELYDELRNLGATVNLSIHKQPVIFQIIRLMLFLQNRSAILHAHLPRAELLASVCKKGNPLVISKHNAEAFFPVGNRFLSRCLSLFVEKQSSQVICISNAVKDFLVGIGELKDTSKHTVIPYGLPTTKKIHKNEKISRRSKSIFTIGCVARLVEQKNISTLLTAFKEFQTRNPNSGLTLVGEGNLRAALMLQSHDLGIENSVRWIGKHPSPHEIMSSFDVMVLPSLYEGFGMVLLEAMLLKVPVIAARNSAIPEVLGSNYIGLFETLDARDLFHKLLLFSLDDTRKKAINQLSKRLQEFDPEKMSETVLKMYQKLQTFD